MSQLPLILSTQGAKQAPYYMENIIDQVQLLGEYVEQGMVPSYSPIISMSVKYVFRMSSSRPIFLDRTSGGGWNKHHLFLSL